MPSFVSEPLHAENEHLPTVLKNNVIGLAVFCKIILGVINHLISAKSRRPWKSYGKDLASPVSGMPGSSRYRPLGGARVSIGRTITDFDLTFSLSI